MLKNSLFVKVALGSLLLIFLRIELVFSDLLPTGGDMGAHIVPTKFFVTELFNNFKLSGWSQDWFAGYPIYYFYFPLPPIITSLLNFLFPFSISFKTMVLISQVLLIISIEFLMRKNQKSFLFMDLVLDCYICLPNHSQFLVEIWLHHLQDSIPLLIRSLLQIYQYFI